jgi:DNA-nicking Smr family endonuclease
MEEVPDERALAIQAGVYRLSIEDAEEARTGLAEMIRLAAAHGMRQVDIVKATGYTREQIRRIVAGRTR